MPACDAGDCTCYQANINYYAAAITVDNATLAVDNAQLSSDQTAYYYNLMQFYMYGCTTMAPKDSESKLPDLPTISKEELNLIKKEREELRQKQIQRLLNSLSQ